MMTMMMTLYDDDGDDDFGDSGDGGDYRDGNYR